MAWIVEIPGSRPAFGRRPWARHKSLPEETPEPDVVALVDRLASSFGCARARNEKVEIARMRQFSCVLRKR